MDITNEKTEYLLVPAGDSRLSGTDYAILAFNPLWSASRIKEKAPLENLGKRDTDAWNCIYIEVEKLSKELHNFIDESRKNEEWEFRFIDKDLYDKLLENCEIETGDYGILHQSTEEAYFELYDEASTDGYYMRFCTDSFPISALE